MYEKQPTSNVPPDISGGVVQRTPLEGCPKDSFGEVKPGKRLKP
jgi:hypothetical protein